MLYMATLLEARAAKMVLRQRLGRPSWLRGVGIGLGKQGHFIKVDVARVTSEVRKDLPDQVQGVRVVVEVLGPVKAQ